MNNLSSPPYKNTLSSSLKDRLKRCGRYHSSPSPTLTKTRCPQSEKITITPKKLDSLTVAKSRRPLNEQLPISTPTRSNKRHSEENDSELCCTPSTAKKLCMDEIDTNTELGTKLLRDGEDGSEFHTNLSTNPGNLLSPLCKSQDSFSTPVSKKSSLRRSKLNLQTTPVSKAVPEIDSPAGSSIDNLKEIKQKLSSSVSGKEEMLRKLKMVKMYRKKNDLSKLEVLIEKWRNVSQEAIQDLQQMLPEPKPNLHDLIQHLQIDDKLLKYNSENDDFD